MAWKVEQVGGLDERLRQTLARNVRIMRAEIAISRRELADMAGISPRYLSLIEAGIKNVSLDTLEMLARALNKTAVELLTPHR